MALQLEPKQVRCRPKPHGLDGLSMGLGLILASVVMRLLFHVGFCG